MGFFLAVAVGFEASIASSQAEESPESVKEALPESAQQPGRMEVGESDLSRRTLETYQRYVQEVIPRLNELTEQTNEAHRRFVQEFANRPTAELEEMNRRVAVTLGMTVRDDENWPDGHEYGGISPESKVMGLDRLEPVKSLAWSACAGGEVRADAGFRATVYPPDGTVAIDGTFALFEGTSCDTSDQVAQVFDVDHDGVANIDFSLPADGTPHTIDAHIRGPGTDEAWIVATFSNVKRD